MSLLARLNLNYLRIFLVVYRTRSMTLAAKQLHLTQSGVSQQIKSLEDTLGITLFDRINRKIIPTSEAELLYAECSRRLDDLESTLRDISKQDGELLGRIKIGISPSLPQSHLLSLLSAFGRQHPKLRYEFRSGFAQEISRWFEDGAIDFALVDAFVNESNLDYDEIASIPYVMLAHEDILQNLPHEQYEQFIRLPFVQYTEGQELMNAWFKKNWGRLPKDLYYRAKAMNPLTVLQLVVEGFAVGLVPEFLAEQAIQQHKTLQILHFKSPVSNRIRAAYLQKRTMGTSARICLQWLRERLDDENRPLAN